MLDWLHELFASVCGQNLAHNWAPGGQLLPCCQRCTGVYVGTCAAALAHLATPPAPTRFWRWLHGIFLLFMIPAGCHWLPQGPALRAASGIIFGFGLVAFFWLPLQKTILPAAKLKNSPATLSVFFGTLLVTLVSTPLLGASESSLAAGTLALGTAAGAGTLVVLLATHLLLAVREMRRRFFSPRVAA